MKTLTRFKNDAELFAFVKKNLYTAAVSDILDDLGYRHQAMHHRLRPLLPDIYQCGFVGRARTILWKETTDIIEEDPYGMEIAAIDSMRAGDVAVHSTDVNSSNAPWGELMSTIARYKKVAGCVCDSQIRDCVKIIEMKFPIYYAGIRPLDSKGRGLVTAYDVPIPCGEVIVHPGDLIFADFDGIIVVPGAIEVQVVEMAKEKVSSENYSRAALMEGKSLREVYNKYKSL